MANNFTSNGNSQLLFLHLDTIEANFSMAQYMVRESEGDIGICLDIDSGSYTFERIVSLRVFSVDTSQSNGGK